MIRPRAFVALALAAVSVGCKPVAKIQPAAPHAALKPAPKPVSRAPAAEFPTLKEAFALAPDRARDKGWEYPLHADKLVPIKSGFALLMSGSEAACVACAPRLSVVYFHRQGDRWAPYHTWRNFYQDGWNGRFGQMDLIDVGQPNPTIAVHGGYFNQGCMVDAIGLIELAPSGPILRVDRAPMGSSGADSDDIYYDASITPLKGRPGLRIRYFGVLEHSKPIDTTVVYSGAGLRWRPHPGILKQDCAGWWKDAER